MPIGRERTTKSVTGQFKAAENKTNKIKLKNKYYNRFIGTQLKKHDDLYLLHTELKWHQMVL